MSFCTLKMAKINFLIVIFILAIKRDVHGDIKDLSTGELYLDHFSQKI